MTKKSNRSRRYLVRTALPPYRVGAMDLPSGYSFATLTRDDIPEVFNFINAWDLEISGVSDFSEDDVRYFTGMKGFDIDRDWWAIRRAGAICGVGVIWPGEVGVRYSTFSIVTPSQRGQGLGSALLERTRLRALERAAEGNGTVLFRTHVDREDPLGAELVKRHGYSYVRSSYTMQAPLPIPGMDNEAWPDGVTVRNLGLDEMELVHELIEDVFAEHWGHSPQAFEDFHAAWSQREELRPDLWWVAEVDGEPIALCIGKLMDEQGWIDDLGVRKAYRGKGIATALLRLAFRAFAAEGCTLTGLGVDASNETGAVKLYESVGLRATRIYDTYEKTFSTSDR